MSGNRLSSVLRTHFLEYRLEPFNPPRPFLLLVSYCWEKTNHLNHGKSMWNKPVCCRVVESLSNIEQFIWEMTLLKNWVQQCSGFYTIGRLNYAANYILTETMTSVILEQIGKRLLWHIYSRTFNLPHECQRAFACPSREPVSNVCCDIWYQMKRHISLWGDEYSHSTLQFDF